MTNPTVTICIPAYNEQNNIDAILKQVFAQQQLGFVIKKIIVASDGSTDNTVKVASNFMDLGVEVIEGKNNLGQTYRQNEMIEKASSDILILLNADLLLGDDQVIFRLITPILKGADLSAQWARPIIPRTFIERVLCAGFELKYFVYTHHNKGNNIYTCVGHMRALSRRFYSDVRFPRVSEGEDQYLYLACISGGYRYEYIHADNLFFKLPDNFKDYKNYARRIFQTQKKYNDVFDEGLVRKERTLPFWIQIRGCFYAILKNPLYAILYIFLHLIIQRWALKQPIKQIQAFEISNSTKSLIH